MINDFIPGRDLEERTMRFAKNVRAFVTRLPKISSNYEDIKQLVRSSGSVGANYIEANEALGRQDFLMKMRISRKECKETVYWLRLVAVGNVISTIKQHQYLLDEAIQLRSILSTIITKCGGSK